MGADKAATLAKERQELEDLYLGIPDESVNLTFKDLPSYGHRLVSAPAPQSSMGNQTPSLLVPIQEHRLNGSRPTIPGVAGDTGDAATPPSPSQKSLSFSKDTVATASFGKSSSLDFARGLEETKEHRRQLEDEVLREQNAWKGRAVAVESSRNFEDFSGFSAAFRSTDGGERRKRRPGIPHSGICTLCSLYVYLFRHRCLVCGRVYCRNCVGIGMGEMTEGRKCVECLGRRFSERYIHKAGETGCLCIRYSKAVIEQEHIWADKGPRERGDGRYGISMVSRSTLLMTPSPSTPRNRLPSAGNEETAFVASTKF